MLGSTAECGPSINSDAANGCSGSWPAVAPAQFVQDVALLVQRETQGKQHALLQVKSLLVAHTFRCYRLFFPLLPFALVAHPLFAQAGYQGSQTSEIRCATQFAVDVVFGHNYVWDCD